MDDSRHIFGNPVHTVMETPDDPLNLENPKWAFVIQAMSDELDLGVDFTADAIELIQVAAEDFVYGIFADAQTNSAQKDMLMLDDFRRAAGRARETKK